MAAYDNMSENRKLCRKGVCFSLMWTLVVLRMQAIKGIEEEKICYDEDLPQCILHRLICQGSSEIAVISAGYSYTTNCTCDRWCTRCRSDGLLLPCRDEYYDADYWNVIARCSKREICYPIVPLQRYYNECSALTAFSHVRYRCVNKTYEINMCSGQKQTAVGSYVSLFFGEENFNRSVHCMCHITGKSSKSTLKYNITALEINMGDTVYSENASLMLKSPNDEYEVTSDIIRPNTHILSTSASSMTVVNLFIKGNFSPEKIWLLVEGTGKSEVQVSCETLIQLEPKHSTTPRQSDKSSVFGGIFGAGVVTGAVVVSLAAVLVYWGIVRRRYNIQRRTHDDVPVSADHPTYAGFLAREDDQTNNYGVITGSTEARRGSANYQNIS